MNRSLLLVLLLVSPTCSTILYDADPNHLWNRLHQALWVRSGPDGKEYGEDRLRPLLGRATNHLLFGPSHEEAVAVLEEFLATYGENLIVDSFKRAVLQRDLWVVLGWVRSAHSTIRGEPLREVAALGGTPLQGISELQRRQAHLQELLAAVILRVALDTAQAAALPDNYAAAIQAGTYPPAFDPAAPGQPFLPPDLFDPEGSWVCLGKPDGPAALRHMKEEFSFEAAAWLVFLRLPGGRGETLAYLERINRLEVHTQVSPNQIIDYLLSLDLPQFPEGTQVALVQRLMSISAEGWLLPTPMTMKVQLRIYCRIPAGREGFASYTVPEVRNWQSYLDFQLSRRALFAGQGRGLLWEEKDEWGGRFQAEDHDIFEGSLEEFEDFVARGWNLNDREGMRCAVCHSGPGVYSFNSFAGGMQGVPNNSTGTFSAPHLYPLPPEEAGRSAVAWKEQQADWRMLRAVLLEEAARR